MTRMCTAQIVNIRRKVRRYVQPLLKNHVRLSSGLMKMNSHFCLSSSTSGWRRDGLLIAKQHSKILANKQWELKEISKGCLNSINSSQLPGLTVGLFCSKVRCKWRVQVNISRFKGYLLTNFYDFKCRTAKLSIFAYLKSPNKWRLKRPTFFLWLWRCQCSPNVSSRDSWNKT